MRLGTAGSAPLLALELLAQVTSDERVRVSRNTLALLLADSQLVIATEGELFLHDLTSSTSRRIARPGDGPGEHRFVKRLGHAWQGGFFVDDLGTARTSLYDAAGRFLRSYSELPPSLEGREVEVLATRSTGGLLIAPWQGRPNRGLAGGIAEGPFERDDVTVMTTDSAGQPQAVVGRWRGLERAVSALDGGATARLPVPFAKTAVYATNGPCWVIAETDSTDAWLLRDTVVIHRIVGGDDAKALSPSERRAWQDRLRRERPDIATTYLRAMMQVPSTKRHPRIAGVALDDRGLLWLGAVSSPGDTARRWQIAAFDGHIVAELDLHAVEDALVPGRTELMDARSGTLVALDESVDGDALLSIHRYAEPLAGAPSSCAVRPSGASVTVASPVR